MSMLKFRKNKIVTTQLIIKSLDNILSPIKIIDKDDKTLMEVPITGGEQSDVLSADVVNDDESADTLADTGLSFSVEAGETYRFKALLAYTAAAITTGARFTVDGPTSPTHLNYCSRATLTASTESVTYASAYDQPAAAGASSLAAGNIAVVEGQITPSADGTVSIRFASEVSASAITVLAGSSLTWRKVS